MKSNRLSIAMCIPMLMFILVGIIYDLNWLASSAEFFTYLILLFGFFKGLDFSNRNIIMFLGFSMSAVLFKFFQDNVIVYYTVMIFQLFSFGFLILEALKHTQRATGNKYMLGFFFLMIIANVYFVSDHFQVLEGQIVGLVEFGLYSIYYITLLALSIAGLIYYLNSYSRKSVYFIVLVMAIVVSGILRDMALYYLPDTSVLLMQSFLQFAAILLAFQFYATREKKLRLIHLV